MFKTEWLHEVNKVHVIPWWRKGQTEKPDCNGSYSRPVRSQTSGIPRPWFPVKDIKWSMARWCYFSGQMRLFNWCFDMDRYVLMIIYYLKIVKNILCWRSFVFMSKIHRETSLKQNKYAGYISSSEAVGICCEPNSWSNRNFSGLSDRSSSETSLKCIYMKRKWRHHGNNASGSHKLITLYVLWLLMLKIAFDFMERSTTLSTYLHIKTLHIRSRDVSELC